MARSAVRAHTQGTEGPVQSASVDESPGLVLLVDDEPLLLRSLERILGPEGHRTLLCDSAGEAESHLANPDLDVVVIDLLLGHDSGLDLLQSVKRQRPEVEVVIITGNASIESAVGCIRLGAFDYLAKPFDDLHRVRTTIRKAIERRRLVERNHALERALREAAGISELVGGSPRMRALGRTIQSLRHNESHVLIQGESGTGKELVARALHQASPRREASFVPVDCGALPETIIESELFGHEKGSFTGATGAPGLFRMADGGTLFLDEIGEVPAHMQAKLLRALQEKEVRPVGAARALPVDIRIVSATHRDLQRMVGDGSFRADLFYRLNVVCVEIPPLRERRDDIPMLVHHFMAKYRGPEARVERIDEAALARLVEQDWPGNVRQLENVVESAMALAQGPSLRLVDLPRIHGSGGALGAGGPTSDLPLSLAAYERCALERALRASGQDVTEAARRLGIGRSTLYRKLGRHGLLARN